MQNKVVIIDNGIDDGLLCKDLETAIFINNSGKVRKDRVKRKDKAFQHGTICALILEKHCPNCILSSIRILDEEGKGAVDKIEPALEWCYQNNVKIVNLSLGTTHFGEYSKLNKLINKYVYRGLIIVAAVSNTGFFTFPASFTNVIGVATVESPLPYAKDYIHLGIDTAVPSEHMIVLGGKEHKTSLSNSYAAPYATALVNKEIIENGTCNIQKLKKFVREKSHIPMVDNLYNPDWVYMAYMQNKRNESKADYYFETVRGSYEKNKQNIDTIIVYSKSELEQINMENKNLIYLGNEDIQNIHISGFKWSWQTRVQQIVNNQYRGNGLEVPLIILDLAEPLDKYFILSKFRDLFGNDGYNAYTVSMEPESVLHRIEYIPDIQMPLTDRLVADFIEGQVYYKQSDLILWNVSKNQKSNINRLYPDCDVEILFNEGKIFVYIEKNIIYKQAYVDLTEECIRTIYDMLVSCMAEEENE